MLIHDLQERKLIQPPKWLADNMVGLCHMGSVAYGVSNDSSDIDAVGICMPPKDLVFPTLAGEIPGFGKQVQRFDVWQEHHVKVPDWGKEYDLTVYSIVKYFALAMDCNPNMLEVIFAPRRCVLYSTPVFETIRENRKSFLHKGAWQKHKGYAFSNFHRYRDAEKRPSIAALRDFQKAHAIPASVGKRRSSEFDFPILAGVAARYDALLDDMNKRDLDAIQTGMDTKAMYHVVRLLCQVEQILIENDLDLERNREQLKSIRRGEWSLERIEDYFATKEKDLESLYTSSTIRHSPDEAKIKQLLLDCLEHHYGDLSRVVARDMSTAAILRDMQAVIDRYAAGAA